MSAPRIVVRPHTVIFAVLLMLLDRSPLALLPFAAAICHELGHIVVMLAFGVNIREIEITMFGAEIRSASHCSGRLKNAAIYAAGAAANVLSAGLAILLLPEHPAAMFFAVCSFALAALNLLPIRTLDGGCIVSILTENKRAADVISALCLAVLWLFSVYLLLLCGGNLSLLLFCIYLFLTLYLE